ncbi:GH1 family beta-glucosidase [Saccharospirillum salsuginis]|uniref:Beta-glucosidase n=1 Tax=Saccharospirillum salsuginis TaxID=418750 RepID=A0A918NBH6_9GAMM|nr:GH1 family beta-glucosidase [Saccharospirillum salsuginis]GGX55817.1 beta-glucosidase [Saccharospirillum salsuginis]
MHSLDLPAHSRLLKPEFTFGVATAAFQVEGATEADGRLPSIWDTFCAEPGRVNNGDTGAVACDHYHRWADDLEMVEGLGVDAYRLSIAWPRVMTESGQPNPKGLDFYKRLLDRLIERGIQPYVTLYHWDLPQHLQDRGGWVNRDTAYRFRDYADLVSRALGDRVASYATLNEPWVSAILGHDIGVHAPGLNDPRLGRQAGHHLLLAHGLGMDVLRTNAPEADAGLVLNMAPSTPKTERYDDRVAARLSEAALTHWFLEPVLEGRYPALFERFYPEQTPIMMPGDLEQISRPVDFIGINYYTRGVVSYDPATGIHNHDPEGVEVTDMGWEVYPRGLTELLVDLDRTYSLPPLIITENGMAGNDRVENGRVHDEQRCRYYNSHLNAVHDAIEQGVDVRGYFAWSLMDNFEWAFGYDKRFGLVHVDYPTQQRTLKDSALAFRDLMARRAASKPD